MVVAGLRASITVCEASGPVRACSVAADSTFGPDGGCAGDFCPCLEAAIAMAVRCEVIAGGDWARNGCSPVSWASSAANTLTSFNRLYL
jgi:hypothetical protein